MEQGWAVLHFSALVDFSTELAAKQLAQGQGQNKLTPPGSLSVPKQMRHYGNPENGHIHGNEQLFIFYRAQGKSLALEESSWSRIFQKKKKNSGFPLALACLLYSLTCTHMHFPRLVSDLTVGLIHSKTIRVESLFEKSGWLSGWFCFCFLNSRVES